MKLFIIVLLLALTGGISALKCYTCTLGAEGTHTNTDACQDPFDSSASDPFVLKLDCANVSKLASEAAATVGISSNFDTCAKTVGTLNGVYTVGRTCFSTSLCPERNGCYSANGATVCCCDTDYCNGAAGMAYNAIITLTVIFAAVILAI